MRILGRLTVIVALGVLGALLAVLINSSVHGPVSTVTTTATTRLTKTVIDTVTRPVSVPVPPVSSPDDALVVLSPRKGEKVASGFTVAGEADVFQGRLVIHLYDAQGTELIRKQETTTCTQDCRGLFSSTLYYSVPSQQTGQLVVEGSSTGGASAKYQVKLPVVLGAKSSG